jgi:hypothetical protein
MLQQQNYAESRDLEWTCQAVSPTDDPCDALASYQCGVCGKWYCAIHAENEMYHSCVLEPGDVGGEG